MIKYSVVTVNYKNSQSVIRLWETLQAYIPAAHFEFILLDNASGEAELSQLKKAFKDDQSVHLIAMEKNLGFGGGYAEAVRFSQGEYLVLINPDIELVDNSLSALSAHLESHGNAGIVAPQLLNPDKTLQQNARDFPRWFQLIGRRLGKKKNILPSGPVPWVQGSFMLMRRRFFTDVLQGFDTRFFLFFEDTDLCRRTWLAGFQVLLCSDVKAIHGADRLSGNDLLRAMMRKTFWIHLGSALKYFWKYKFKPLPKTD